jgi:hypothetical protein
MIEAAYFARAQVNFVDNEGESEGSRAVCSETRSDGDRGMTVRGQKFD